MGSVKKTLDGVKQHPLVKKLGFNRVILCLVLLIMYLVFCLSARNFTGIDRIFSALNYVYSSVFSLWASPL